MPKTGRHSVGVHRRLDTVTGREVNCQRALGLYLAGELHSFGAALRPRSTGAWCSTAPGTGTRSAGAEPDTGGREGAPGRRLCPRPCRGRGHTAACGRAALGPRSDPVRRRSRRAGRTGPGTAGCGVRGRPRTGRARRTAHADREHGGRGDGDTARAAAACDGATDPGGRRQSSADLRLRRHGPTAATHGG
ncbi:hypothetical protein [Streptomyces sp. NPDC046197]|uniref:hypothetical protein n=1 Tax=Streptomyces sp. NPDC046197 TaxID=3154337 RepID=UPI0033CDCA06